MELHIFARFHALPGRAEALAAAIRDVLPETREEPGCLAVEVFRSTREISLFFMHSRWRDETAFDLHGSLPHTLGFLATVRPLLRHELDVNRTVLVEHA